MYILLLLLELCLYYVWIVVSQDNPFFVPDDIPATPLSLPASIGIHSFSQVNNYKRLRAVTMPFDLSKCARKNILKLEPYRCAREYVQC